MATIHTTLLNKVTLQPGQRAFGPVAVPDALSSATLTVDRTQWTDPTVVLAVTLDLSIDGGVTWASMTPSEATDPFPIAFESEGGAVLDKNGNPSLVTSMTADFPPVSNRQLRGTITLTGGPLTTTVGLVTA